MKSIIEHAKSSATKTKWIFSLGFRASTDHDALWVLPGALSRTRRTRQKAWAQGHGSKLGFGSRAVEGRISQGAAQVSGFPSILTLRSF